MSTARRRSLPLAALLVLTATISACGDDDSSASDDGAWVTSTTEGTSTTDEASTTAPPTTEAPRALTEEDLLGVLLQPEDVPHHLVLDEKEPPPGWQATEPPGCGEQLSGEGPGQVRATSMFIEADGFLAFESIAEHTPGEPEDLDAIRAAIAGPCSEPYRHVTTDGIDTMQRMTLLEDLDIGDDALSARFDVNHTVEGWPVETWAYMIYFRRGDVSIQVQAITGAVPEADLAGPDISMEEVERLARRLDERLAALQSE